VSVMLLAVAMVVAAPCDEAWPLHNGDLAKCDGVLIPGWEAMQALRCLNVAFPECRADILKLEGTVGALTISHEREVSALNLRIEEADRALSSMARCPECERAWWDNTGLAFATGVLTTTAVVVALLFGAK
jgi:hypothetical protein